jgi:hypothetical protein
VRAVGDWERLGRDVSCCSPKLEQVCHRSSKSGAGALQLPKGGLITLHMSRIYYDRFAVDLVHAEAMAYGDFGRLLADQAKSKPGP